MAKVFEVSSYCTTVQSKYVLADSAEAALKMTEDDNWEWKGKDEIVDSYTKVSAPVSPVSYVETSAVDYVEFDPQIHALATEEDCPPEEDEEETVDVDYTHELFDLVMHLGKDWEDDEQVKKAVVALNKAGITVEYEDEV